jgi:hypothetical protein
MQYFEVPARNGNGLCSDDECPCDNTVIRVGQGYIYISKDCCDFRWDCRTDKELDAKVERMTKQTGQYVIFGNGVAAPVLVCEVGAKKRQLDLRIAAQDAKHWWATGQVPFRPTPRAGEPEVAFSKGQSNAELAKKDQRVEIIVGAVFLLALGIGFVGHSAFGWW